MFSILVMPRRPIPDPVIVSLSSGAPLSKDREEETTNHRQQNWVQAFLQSREDSSLSSQSLSPNTLRAYRQDLQRFADWGSVDWEMVTQKQVNQYKNFLIKEKELSVATVNRSLTTLKKFYRWLINSHYLSHDPTVGIALLEQDVQPATSAHQPLSEGEIVQIYQAALDGSFPERDTVLLSILLHGVRVEEAVALNVGNFDGTQFSIPGVSNRRAGDVPLHTTTIQQIDDYLFWRKNQGEAILPDRPFLISLSRRTHGQRLTYKGVWEVIKKLQRSTGIDLHAHRFRHLFTIDLLTQGVAPEQVLSLTRLKSIQTLKRYQSEDPA